MSVLLTTIMTLSRMINNQDFVYYSRVIKKVLVRLVKY